MSEVISIGLAIFSSMLAALGQLGLKFGSMRLKLKLAELMENYALLAGLSLYGASIVAFIVALRGHDLTVLYPIASLNYIWVNLLSMKYLKENMNILKWSGTVLIIIGVSLIV